MGRCAGPQPPCSDFLESSYCHTQQCCLDSRQSYARRRSWWGRSEWPGGCCLSPRLGGWGAEQIRSFVSSPTPKVGDKHFWKDCTMFPNNKSKHTIKIDIIGKIRTLVDLDLIYSLDFFLF